MLDKTDDISLAVESWLAYFERALGAPDDGTLDGLFHLDSFWRDVLALSWNLQTVNGAAAILHELAARTAVAKPTTFRIDPDRAPPRRVIRVGTSTIEAIFKFETALGRGSGIVRLIPDAGDANRLKAWTLLTALDELKGYEERQGTSRPRGQAYSRDFRGPNWLDQRKAAVRYDDRDPDVLVVGGGQAGLSIAARLKQLRIDTLIVDRGEVEATADRYTDRRSRSADRRQLAQTLSCADAAQSGASQPSALHAVPAELAGLYSEG
jgi:hypothetical protein